MELDLIYDSQEAIPDGYSELYTERDGKYHFTGIKGGVKTQTDVDKLKSALQKERDDHSESKKVLKNFESYEPEKLKADLQELEELRITKGQNKLDDEQVNKLVDSRIKSKVGPVERERDQFKEQLEGAKTELTTLREKTTSSSIETVLTTTATELGVRKEAVKDVLARKGLFTIDEEGKIITKENSGVTPGLQPKDWLADELKVSPHWLESSKGTKTDPNKGNAPQGSTQSKNAQMTEIIEEAFEPSNN